MPIKLRSVSHALMLCVAVVSLSSMSLGQDSRARPGRVPVTFTEGHRTELGDRDLPVKLIAGALGIPDEIFRKTVPSPRSEDGVAPRQRQMHVQKSALVGAMRKYDVSEPRLDEVLAHYEYAAYRGELWPTVPAKAFATVENGRVTSIQVVSGGSGYCSPPTVTVPGATTGPLRIQISYGAKFEDNGSISSITLAPAKKVTR